MQIRQLDIFGNESIVNNQVQINCLFCGRKLLERKNIPISDNCYRKHIKESKKMEKLDFQTLDFFIKKFVNAGFRFIRISGDDRTYSIDQRPDYTYDVKEKYRKSLETRQSAVLIVENATLDDCANNKPMKYLAFFRDM